MQIIAIANGKALKKCSSAVHHTEFAQKDNRRKQEYIYVSLCTMKNLHSSPCSVLQNI